MSVIILLAVCYIDLRLECPMDATSICNFTEQYSADALGQCSKMTSFRKKEILELGEHSLLRESWEHS